MAGPRSASPARSRSPTRTPRRPHVAPRHRRSRHWPPQNPLQSESLSRCGVPRRPCGAAFHSGDPCESGDPPRLRGAARCWVEPLAAAETLVGREPLTRRGAAHPPRSSSPAARSRSPLWRPALAARSCSPSGGPARHRVEPLAPRRLPWPAPTHPMAAVRAPHSVGGGWLPTRSKV